MFFSVLSAFFLGAGPARAATPPDAQALIAEGHSLYQRGRSRDALLAYRRAVKLDSEAVAGWINGAVLLEDLGQPKEARKWWSRAASLTSDPEVGVQVGWAGLAADDLAGARKALESALARAPEDPLALLGLARVRLGGPKPAPEAALPLLDRAARNAPLLTLIPFWQGIANGKLGRNGPEIEGYRKSVAGDSYFFEGREALGQAHLRESRFNEAWRQFSRILDADPRNKRFRALIEKLRPRLTKNPSEIRPSSTREAPDWGQADEGKGSLPILRVGIGTTPMGRPLPRQLVTFSPRTSFWLADARTGRRLIPGKAGEAWQATVRIVKKRAMLDITDPSGKSRLRRRESVLIRPDSPNEGFTVLKDIPYARGSQWTGVADKVVRGDLELSLWAGGRSLRLVNWIDLENYTHGVVSAEMPVQSPLEALKAQGVMARGHALYIKTMTRRHRKDGYDLCDEQHCQVYGGVRYESARSRAAVAATRGKILTYKGRPAHVIYSSNCGGRTQSVRDVGWGDVPYWVGIVDSPEASDVPRAPWDFRRWLQASPQAYCKPSAYVHSSHFRWTRVIPVKDLEDKLRRKKNLGRLLSVAVERRSPAGNALALKLTGSKGTLRVDSELSIRGMLGTGSLRSTLFFIRPEADAAGRLERLVLHGGGWGHGVGLCQSGAMGRAEAGEPFEAIVKAYFPGTELGSLKY